VENRTGAAVLAAWQRKMRCRHGSGRPWRFFHHHLIRLVAQALRRPIHSFSRPPSTPGVENRVSARRWPHARYAR